MKNERLRFLRLKNFQCDLKLFSIINTFIQLNNERFLNFKIRENVQNGSERLGAVNPMTSVWFPMWLGAKPALVWNHTNFYVKGPSVACAIAKIWPRFGQDFASSAISQNIAHHALYITQSESSLAYTYSRNKIARIS